MAPTGSTQAHGSTLPTGTVTFLFTDIQGSTPLWEREPQKMAEALPVHNAALRRAIESNGGAVYKIVGDSFQASFDTAPQALKAAIEGQKALQSAPWNELGELKVRMGLHTGEAELDPGGDEYAVSHTKNRAARIMSAANGGQILLSEETADLVKRKLPEGVTLKDLGENRLKGMEWLEHLYQVCALGLLWEFPPLATSAAHPHNLPAQLTSFIGRAKEIDEVCRLLESHRLVTLTGSGGTGKTRLSLQVAATMLEQYPHGAWLVDLAPLADPILVPQTVASALNLPEIPGKSIQNSLLDYLRTKRLLLILDNCEHLLEACASLVDLFLRSCPELTILASSREFLGVGGEAPYRVPPMALPDVHHLPAHQTLLEYDAVRLFVERARLASPGFTVTESNAAVVAQVVNRLDGIPLAIELAASRLRMMDIEQIAQRLSDAFRLLTGGSRTALPRHQTLRAMIDWSYNLLSEPERVLLRRLSVFAGGWRLQAAELVCSDANGSDGLINPEDILDLLSELVDKSLIYFSGGADEINRFRMLETIRQYAHEKLVDEGEAEAMRTCHLGYYLGQVEEMEPRLRGLKQIETLDRLEIELDNLRLALEWALQADVEAELRLATAMMWFWHIHFHWPEGVGWLEQGLELEKRNRPLTAVDESASPPTRRLMLRAKALSALAFHDNMQRKVPQAKAALEESLVLYRQAGPEYRAGLAFTLKWLGSCAKDAGDPLNALMYNQEALGIYQEIGDHFGMAECWGTIGDCEFEPGLKNKAYQEELSNANAAGDEDAIATALQNLGWSAIHAGEYQKACRYFMESADHYRKVGNPISIAHQLFSYGISAFFMGETEQAARWMDEAQVIYQEIGSPAFTIFSCYFWKVAFALSQGDFPQAQLLIDKKQALVRETGDPSILAWLHYLSARVAGCQGELGEAAQQARACLVVGRETGDGDLILLAAQELGKLALGEGDLLQAEAYYREGLQGGFTMKYSIFKALPLAGLAVLAARQNHIERSARLFGCAEGFFRGLANYLSPAERLGYSADRASVREALGEDDFSRLYAEGQLMTLEQAVAFALEAKNG
jgi:predicted ATPase/class 3 adenylate cyclase